MQKARRRFTVIEGQRGKKQKRNFKGWLLFATIMSAILLAAWFEGRKLAARFMVETVVAYESVLEHALSVEGVLVREEKVAVAPASGLLHWLVQDGERVPNGYPVAEITALGGTVVTVTAPKPGIFVRRLDGYEQTIQPHGLSQINPALLQRQAESAEEEELSIEAVEGTFVQKGSFLFKIVDNFPWYYVAQFAGNRFTKLEEQGKVVINFAFTGKEANPVAAKVTEIRTEGELVTAVFQLQEEVNGYYRERFAQAEIIYAGTRGIVLPPSALVQRDQEVGVYVLIKSKVRFCKVEVLDTKDDQVAVSGIQPGLPVIINPSWVEEGQQL